MKGLLSKGIALQADVIGPENILFAGASLHFFCPEILQAVAVKGLIFTQLKQINRDLRRRKTAARSGNKAGRLFVKKKCLNVGFGVYRGFPSEKKGKVIPRRGAENRKGAEI